MMKNIPNFNELKSELYKEDIYRQMKTLCFDIESVFVRKINLKEYEELNTLKHNQNYELNYVVINKQDEVIGEYDSDSHKDSIK